MKDLVPPKTPLMYVTSIAICEPGLHESLERPKPYNPNPNCSKPNPKALRTLIFRFWAQRPSYIRFSGYFEPEGKQGLRKLWQEFLLGMTLGHLAWKEDGANNERVEEIVALEREDFCCSSVAT